MSSVSLPPDFVSGTTKYRTEFDGQPRIVVPVRFDSSDKIDFAILDTASTRCILNPETAKSLGLKKPEDALTEMLQYRKDKFAGWIERVTLELVVDEQEGGESLPLDVRVLIPEPLPSTSREYSGPNFLGMLDLLEAMRFAVDPNESHFYFGGLYFRDR